MATDAASAGVARGGKAIYGAPLGILPTSPLHADVDAVFPQEVYQLSTIRVEGVSFLHHSKRFSHVATADAQIRQPYKYFRIVGVEA